MDNYKNIRKLIENNLVEVRKQEISVNQHTLMTYFNVGKLLVKAQGGKERAKYGDNLIKEYSKKLIQEFGKGYNTSNLKRMRQLYLTFEKSATVSHQLSWSHYIEILKRNNINERNYYINLSVKNRLSVRELRNEIKNKSYNRLKNKEDIKLDVEDKEEQNIIDMIKDPILIGLNKNTQKRITEKALRKLMIDNISKTMLELGIGFSYIGSEQRIKLDTKYHYVDIVLFNLKINCYVLIELKINKLMHRDIGQLELYINYYDDEIKERFHNKTIGILITKKNDINLLKYMNKENIVTTTYKVKEDEYTRS